MKRPFPRGPIMLAATSLAALVQAGSAFAHATISPVVTKPNALQLFTLAVPTEKEGGTTIKVELTPPSGFSIDSFAPAPGWTRAEQTSGSGEETTVNKVTWTGGRVPTGEDSVFQFLADPSASKSYSFKVRQTYSDGSLVDWTGPESSDTPAPVIEAKSSVGGGSGTTLAIVALVVAAVGMLIAFVALVGGRRQLA
jgi:uncharacterized protein YcnI